ncbi:MAG: riboflavin synthase [Planctomycetota bacterium]
MFTGIVERAVEVTSVEDHKGGRRIALGHRWGDESHGESIAVNGCCLTISDMTGDSLAFDVIRETLDKTNLGDLSIGDRVHVERALRVGDRFDGHIVQGHVDGQAELIDRTVTPEEWRLRVRPPSELVPFVLTKGSVCIDGVSLTVAGLGPDWFEVALIPTTLDLTALGEREVGWHFNFEADVMAKGVVETVRRLFASGDLSADGLPSGDLSAMMPRRPDDAD